MLNRIWQGLVLNPTAQYPLVFRGKKALVTPQTTSHDKQWQTQASADSTYLHRRTCAPYNCPYEARFRGYACLSQVFDIFPGP